MLNFRKLIPSDFSLLTKWLNSPHVHDFWGENIHWTEEQVKAKYQHHPQGFQIVNGEKKPIHAFIIIDDDLPIGFIQYYNAYDYPRKDCSLNDLLADSSYFFPNLAGLDLFIGEKTHIGKGLSSLAITLFLDEFVWPNYSACIIDPDKENHAAINAYKKSGFTPLKAIGDVLFMICFRKK